LSDQEDMNITNKKNNLKPKKTSHRTKKESFSKELNGLVTLFVSILCMLALYTENSFGIIGTVLSNVLKGFFGFGAYIFPFIVFAMGIIIFLGISKKKFKNKLILITVDFLSIIALVHTISATNSDEYKNIWDYFTQNYKNGGVNSGGVVGAALGNSILILAGKAGSQIILIFTSLILFALITGKPFMKLLINKIHEVAKSLRYEENEYIEPEEIGKKTKKQNAKSDIPNSYKSLTKTDNSRTFLLNEHENVENRRILLFNEELSGVTYENTEDDTIKKQTIALSEIEQNMESDISKNEYSSAERELRGEIFINTSNNVIIEPLNTQDTVNITYSGAYLDDGFTTKIQEPREIESDMIEYGTQTLVDTHYYEKKIIKDNIIEVPIGTRIVTKLKDTLIDLASREIVYEFPYLELLNKTPLTHGEASKAQILENSKKLEDTLKSFGVEAKVVEVSKGPTVTRYELSPGQGVKVSKISGLADDLALNLAASGIRIEAPIPGKAAVGIEIPNKETTPVFLREVLEDESFKSFPSSLAFGLGKDIAGKTVVADIAKMPHMLIAGATGSGKSVCINTLITSLIYKSSPRDVKLLMIDPKVVELSIYNGIPHLLIPVVTEPKKAAGALNWAVSEMISRYNYFAETSVRDLKGYNEVLEERGVQKLPQIVIIIDELADLMMVAPGEVEDAICRLAQMARAAGIHLIIATQRPSVDVITGLIKANIPSRLAFSVSSGIDSRTILDSVGAEKLLGKGDMLFFPVGMSKPQRVQGAFISDKEVENIVKFIKGGKEQNYDQEMIDKITATKNTNIVNSEVDEFFMEAISFVIQKDKASASMLQRQATIGHHVLLKI
jgi:DNA segregation ATPase FtsK/SpoIIIE, S-DNA-T family